MLPTSLTFVPPSALPDLPLVLLLPLWLRCGSPLWVFAPGKFLFSPSPFRELGLHSQGFNFLFRLRAWLSSCLSPWNLKLSNCKRKPCLFPHPPTGRLPLPIALSAQSHRVPARCMAEGVHAHLTHLLLLFSTSQLSGLTNDLP